MSCGNSHQYSCEDIYISILLLVDHEPIAPEAEQSLTQHCVECPPCGSTLATHQQDVLQLKDLLTSACREQAPQSLHERILMQTHELALQMQAAEFAAGTFTQTFTESFSQRSITFDGQTIIEISHTQEFREGF